MNHVVVHVLLWHDNNLSTLQSWSEMLRITRHYHYAFTYWAHQGIVNSLSELLRLEKDY